jgi:hypothetical protein
LFRDCSNSLIAITFPENAEGVVCNCLPVFLQFSLPMPQGGRDAITKNPILREDQLPQKVLHPKLKKSSKVSALAFLSFFRVLKSHFRIR